MITKKALLLVGFILSYALLFGFDSRAEEARYPAYTGYVNDFANILSSDTKDKITALAQHVQTKTSVQIAVVTLGSVHPLTIEEYAVGLFQHWGIGQVKKDNGVLILVAVTDRSMKIETGYGLEGILPDALCYKIISQVMIPQFKQGSIDKGILYGTIAVAELIANGYNIELNLADTGGYEGVGALSPGISVNLWVFIIICIILIIFFMPLWMPPYRNSRRPGNGRGSYWYGGDFGGSGGSMGGGFGGFGGGLSGGGGATGRW